MTIKAWYPIGGTLERLSTAPAGDTFVLGTTKPDATNTGLTDIPLNVWTGNLIASTAGATYQNLEIRGQVKVQAANVTFINCWVRGNNNFGPNGEDALADCRSASCVNATFERCLFLPQYPNPFYTGIIGHDYTAIRCDVHNTVDGFGIYKTQDPGGPVNVQLKGCYAYGLSYYKEADVGFQVHPSDTQTHNDCLQIQGGSNTLVYGCNFQGFFDLTVPGTSSPGRPQANACIQYNNNVGSTTDMTVQYSWFDGGGASLNAALDNTNIGDISYNKFGRNQALQSSGGDMTYTINLAATTTCTTVGNVYEDNGHAVYVRHNG
jgi:hypothetical protein